MFEKVSTFQRFISEYKDSGKFYSVCSVGVPSKSCLEHLRKFRDKRIFYFGDLDAESLWVYLTFVFGNRKFGKNSKIKFNVKFAGLTPNDYDKFLSKKNVLIKIEPCEEKILEFISDIKISQLLDKIRFLKKGYKVEIEALSLIGFDKYFESKIKNL